MIRVPEVRLISADGRQAGVVSTDQAMELARDNGLDLVEVSPDGAATGVQDPRLWQVQV